MKAWRVLSEPLLFLAVDNPFQRIRKPRAEIKKSSKATGENGNAVEGSRKVGLKPKAGWQKRNFVTEVLIPSIFEPRSGGQAVPNFPELKDGEICITWI